MFLYNIPMMNLQYKPSTYWYNYKEQNMSYLYYYPIISV